MRRSMMFGDNIYEPLKYIESSGSQYIDTGLFLDYSKQFSLSMDFYAKGINERQCFFSNISVPPVNSTSIWCELAVNNQYRFGFASTNILYSQLSLGENSVSFTHNESLNFIEVNEQNSPSYVDNRTSTAPASLLMFRDYRSSIFTNRYQCKNATIIVDNLLIRNFIPCCRKYDNKIGMYDVVGKQFYDNQGTGEFGYEQIDGTYVAPIE